MPLPLGFVRPCLSTKTPQPSTGDARLKHDGSRLVARRRPRAALQPAGEIDALLDPATEGVRGSGEGCND
jgi:hypothetical protein